MELKPGRRKKVVQRCGRFRDDEVEVKRQG